MSYIGRRGASAALTTADIPDDSITTAKLIDSSVTSAKIGVDVIVAEDIANNAITVAEIADGAVTAAKAPFALPLAGGTMTGNIVMGDDTSIGIADDAERIEFDGAGDISILGANLGIGTDAPSSPLSVYQNSTNTHISVQNDTKEWILGVRDDASDGFILRQDGTTHLTVAHSGNVGIGTTAPSANLHVNSTVQTLIRVEGVNAYSCGIKIRNNYSSVQSDWNLGASGGTSGWGGNNGNFVIRDDTTNSTAIEFERGAGGAVGALYINSVGNVGIGTTATSSTRLYVDSIGNDASTNCVVFRDSAGANLMYISDNGYTWVGTGWTTSDRNKKENISYVTEDVLPKIEKLKLAKFDIIDKQKNCYGFIAQDVEELFPYCVDDKVFEGEEQKNLNYTYLFSTLIKSIQELSAKVTTLENA